MKNQRLTLWRIAFILLAFAVQQANAEPPYQGTVWLDPDILTEEDPTTFTGIDYMGRGSRVMYDRRVENWIVRNCYLFSATYSDGNPIEIQVNPEFGSRLAAQEPAAFYAEIFGRLPAGLRRDAESSWIHKGDAAWGGGNNNFLIYVDSLDIVNNNLIEEVLIHEGVHTSMDADYSMHPNWRKAQQDDPDFISTYARDFPDREDLAESYLPYLAIRYRRDRIPEEMARTIEATMPNRIAFFDSLDIDLAPMVANDFRFNAGLNDAWYNPETPGQGFFITVFPDLGLVFLAMFSFETAALDGNPPSLLGDSRHRWLTAIGSYDGDSATLNMTLTRGGVFDSGTPLVERISDYGTFVLHFTDCNSGTISYDIPAAGLAGEIPIQRVVEDNAALCEAMQEN